MLSAARLTHFTAPDGYRFAVHQWQHPRPSARLVFLHGIVSHAGWYPRSCRHLAQEGVEVHFLDRRGSGLNLAGRGDVAACRTWMDDVEAYLEQLPRDAPRLLMGISWGGALAAAVAGRRPDLLSGMGLLCPGLYARQAANAAQGVAIRLAHRAGFGKHRVSIPLQDPALFTTSAAFQEYIRTDPLTLRRITIRFAAANLQLLHYATEAPEAIHVPTLLMLAERDAIVHNERVRAWADRIACDRKETVEYRGAGHTLEFEPDPSRYFADLADWVRRFTGQRSANP
ncbi:MAG: alpha/beta fold hydrolase [Pirellulales bacterium]|nr:alpha/beta fold hydrolase [Pirellulales bacterium]